MGYKKGTIWELIQFRVSNVAISSIENDMFWKSLKTAIIRYCVIEINNDVNV